MKKLLFILLLTIACIGCERVTPTDKKSENAMYGWNYITEGPGYVNVKYRIVIINNHEYIIFTNHDYHSGGICVIHSESCPCKHNRLK